MASLFVLSLFPIAFGRVTLWRTCQGPAPAYAAAWFARRDTVQETVFGDKLGMEYHDFYMFNQGGNGHPRVSLKSADAEEFWVDHMSELERSLKRSRHRTVAPGTMEVDHVQEAASRSFKAECNGDERRDHQEIIAVIPYWGGLPETDSNGKVVGNSHSKANRALKETQLRATACSIRNVLGARVVIGIAKEEDRIEGEEVWMLQVEHGAYLAFGMLRELQRRIEEEGMACDYVYFTEADQILHGSLAANDLKAAVGQHIYVAPNRLKQLVSNSRTALFESGGVHYGFSQNICSGDLVATVNSTLLPPPPPLTSLKGIRGNKFTVATPKSGERAPATDDQVDAAREKIEWRNGLKRDSKSDRRTYGSSGKPTLVSSTNATRFARCWNPEDKLRSTSWFVHTKQFLASNFDNLKDPLKSLQVFPNALDEIKRSKSWHSWSLTSADPSDFATCRQCRGRWPPSSYSLEDEGARRYHHHHHRSHNNAAASSTAGRRRKRLYEERRLEAIEDPQTTTDPHTCALYSSGLVAPAKLPNATDTVALLPIDEAMLSDQAAATSICSARETFSTVIVGYCSKDHGHSALVARLEVLLGVGYFSKVALDDCVVRNHATTRSERETSAALLLVKHAAAQLDATENQKWPFVNYIFFAPLGDLIVVRDLDALRSAVSPATYVVAHRYHDTKDALDTAIRSPSCDQAHRDWIIPLSSPHRRSDVNSDLSAYLVIPR